MFAISFDEPNSTVLDEGALPQGLAIRHCSRRDHISSKTSSPETGLTAPDLISSRRRLATSAHFLSISDSGGFRLLSTESATRARSSKGSDSISRNKIFCFHKDYSENGFV